MTARSVQVENEVEALVVEQALAMTRELTRTCKLAPDGEVLHLAEVMAVEKGRELTRKSLEAVLNAQAEEVEKKGRLPGTVRAGASVRTAAAKRGRSRRRPAR